MYFLEPKFLILYLFFFSTAYIHLRGKVRLRILRQLTDHSTFMAPINAFVYLFSAVPNTPILDRERLPQLDILRDNWQVIRDEALNLMNQGQIKKADKYNDLAFNSFFKRGWKRFYFKWYGAYFPSAKELCPKTIEILDSVPGVNAAMLTLLSPGSHLNKHRDPFAGSLRYHLGLITPNSQKCRILVDGNEYYWRDGEDFLFDETYVHQAFNETDETRVILFCDMERPLRFGWARWINRVVSKVLGHATASENMAGDRVGVFNRLFQYVYYIQGLGKKMKTWNKTVYYALKYAVLLALLYLIIT